MLWLLAALALAVDAGPVDAGQRSDPVGPEDAGAPDAGQADAGPPDAGDPFARYAEPRAAQLPTLFGPAPAPVDAGPGLAPGEAPTAEYISRAVAGQEAAFHQCVEEEQRRHPTWLATRVTLGWTIAPSGKVERARVGDPKIARSALGKCLVGVVAAIQFPAFEGEPIPVEFPISLSPKTGRR